MFSGYSSSGYTSSGFNMVKTVPVEEVLELSEDLIKRNLLASIRAGSMSEVYAYAIGSSTLRGANGPDTQHASGKVDFKDPEYFEAAIRIGSTQSGMKILKYLMMLTGGTVDLNVPKLWNAALHATKCQSHLHSARSLGTSSVDSAPDCCSFKYIQRIYGNGCLEDLSDLFMSNFYRNCTNEERIQLLQMFKPRDGASSVKCKFSNQKHHIKFRIAHHDLQALDFMVEQKIISSDDIQDFWERELRDIYYEYSRGRNIKGLNLIEYIKESHNKYGIFARKGVTAAVIDLCLDKQLTDVLKEMFKLGYKIKHKQFHQVSQYREDILEHIACDYHPHAYMWCIKDIFYKIDYAARFRVTKEIVLSGENKLGWMSFFVYWNKRIKQYKRFENLNLLNDKVNESFNKYVADLIKVFEKFDVPGDIIKYSIVSYL